MPAALRAALFGLCAITLLCAGCGRAVKGPRFWWDDQKREKLGDDYMLPPAPEARPPTPMPHDVPEPLKDDKERKREKESGRAEPKPAPARAAAPAPARTVRPEGPGESSAGAIPLGQ